MKIRVIIQFLDKEGSVYKQVAGTSLTALSLGDVKDTIQDAFKSSMGKVMETLATAKLPDGL